MQNESWERAIAESRAWTSDEAARAVAAWESSGQTASAFARRCGSTAGRFQYWRKRLRVLASEGDARLLPVKIVESGQARLVEREPGRLVLVKGALRVEMSGMPAVWVATLIRLLCEGDG